MSATKQTLTEALHQVMVEFEAEMLEEQKTGAEISKKTNRFIKAVIYLFFAVSVYLMIEAYYLTKDVKLLSDHMVQMYENFGKMAVDMNEMTGSVVHMSKNVKTIPIMTSEMGKMVAHVGTMNSNVASMTKDVTVMDKNLGFISQAVHHMTEKFIQLNQSVGFMRHNVGKMAQPIRKMPFM